MYHINLSHISDILADEEAYKKLKQKCDKTYQDIIIGNLLNQQPRMSACVACTYESCPSFPIDERDIAEVHCEGILGTEFCELPESLHNKLQLDDLVIVNNDGCEEIGKVLEFGEIVQIKRKELELYQEEIPKIIRKANEKDLRAYQKNLEDEINAVSIFKEKIRKHSLEMKLVDIHYQFDRRKLYFYYTANGRIDFRELAKDLASIYKTRIELRQMGVRDEAKKVGGMGMCGREYCCSSFIQNFKRISSQTANEQNLGSSFSKLSGPCGKLKCCLSFEMAKNN